MIGNCHTCNEKYYLRYYPIHTTIVPIECPCCHHKEAITVTGEIERMSEIWFPPDLVDRLREAYLFKTPDEVEPQTYQGRWPDLETEYNSDTSSSLKDARIELRGTHASLFPYSTDGCKNWDKRIDKNFEASSFNLSHINKKNKIENYIWDRLYEPI